MSYTKNVTQYVPWLLIGLLFCLFFVSEHEMPMWDLTRHKYNSLTPETLATLKKITVVDPLQIEVITINLNNHDKVQTLLHRLQKACPFIKISYRNKPLSPSEQQKFGISTHEALIFQLGHQQRAIDISQNSKSPFSEKQIQNTISQLQQTANHWLLFVTGHGERSIFGKTNRDLSAFASELKSKSISYSEFDLSQQIEIPSNTHLMILAGPQTDFLIKEQQRVLDYLEKGGHLLWLIDPPNHASAATTTSPLHKESFLPSLQILTKVLGLELEPDFIMDPASHTLGTPSQAITLVNQYTKGTFVESLSSISVFPWATPIRYPGAEDKGWDVTPFLKTNQSTYLQAKPDKKGSMVIGLSLERAHHPAAISPKIQRVVVIGNGHFLSNATLHNYGNRQLLDAILNWFEHGDTQAQNQPYKTPSSPSLGVSHGVSHNVDWHPLPLINFILQYFITGILPLGLIVLGLLQSHKRKGASQDLLTFR